MNPTTPLLASNLAEQAGSIANQSAALADALHQMAATAIPAGPRWCRSPGRWWTRSSTCSPCS